jgi:hypothetical protein
MAKITAEVNYDNLVWIQSNIIRLNMFNKYESEDAKNKEIKDLILIQDELLNKLRIKEGEINKMKMEARL